MPLREWIAEAAREAGLDLVGVVGVAALDALPASRDAAFFAQWLERGYAGEMGYLTGERAEKRREPQRVLAGVKSAICAALNYHSGAPLSNEPTEPGRGWISRYAWGSDYHDVLRTRLERLLERLRTRVGEPFEARVYVDTGPVLERALARQTPLGWLGKNTCLLNERLGSWFFLGEILTTLEIPADEPAADRCGTCTRCIDACPTQALREPRVLDSTRCISYWTIEYKGEIPEAIMPGIGRHVFGCDICQDVCPWNRRAPVTGVQEFQPRPGLVNPSLDELAAMTPEQFRKRFRHSPVRRLGYRRFMRNVEVAKKNLAPRR
jgi:epoxyqueuosine reductase